MSGNLIDYKDIHKGDDVYIIGSGSSCDFIDQSFFENKITIGINQVYKKYKTTYLVRKEFSLLKESVNNKDADTTIFISKGNCGGNNNKNKEYINKIYPNSKNIIVYDHNNNGASPAHRITKEKLNNLNDNQLVVSHSTITTGIYLAAYMGAKNIILVGHDCGTIDAASNFKGYHTLKTMVQKNQKQYNNWLNVIEQDTIVLKKYLKNKYNCNVHSLNPFVSFKLEGHKFK